MIDSASRHSSSSLDETIDVRGREGDVVTWHCVDTLLLFMFSDSQCAGHAFLCTMILYNRGHEAWNVAQTTFRPETDLHNKR